MIEELTREQIDARPAYSRKWSRIAFSSGNTDRRRSESAIRALYEIAGLERPDILIWLRSPLEACLAIHILSDHVDSAYHAISNGIFAKLRAQVWDHISLDARVQAWIPAVDEFRRMIRDQMLDLIAGGINEIVRTEVLAGIKRTPGCSSWSSIPEHSDLSLTSDALDLTWDSACGPNMRTSISHFDFCHSELGLACHDTLTPWTVLLESCGWWWPLEGAAILTDRPSHWGRDGLGRLHSENRAAVEFLDGFGVYAWNGVRIPKDVILNPEKLTVQRINSETNTEIRRVMLQRYGDQRYLQNIGAAVVDTFSGGTLLRAEVADDAPLVMLKVVNATVESDGSRKKYYLRVPPAMKDAREALAWTFSLSRDKYHPLWES